MKVRVAVLQYKWEDEVDATMTKVISMIEKAAKDDAEIVCLPEFSIGPPWFFPNCKHYKGQTDISVSSPIIERFKKTAQDNKLDMVVPTLIREEDGIYNTALLIDSSGEIIGKVRKIHPFLNECFLLKTGSEFPIFHVQNTRVGILICSDFYFVECPRILSIKGAEILFVPGILHPHDRGLIECILRAYSVLNGLYIVFAGVIGKIEGKEGVREFIGHSTVVGPHGTISSGGEEESITTATLDLSDLRKMREPMANAIISGPAIGWVLWGRRPQLYGEITKDFVDKTDNIESYFLKKAFGFKKEKTT